MDNNMNNNYIPNNNIPNNNDGRIEEIKTKSRKIVSITTLISILVIIVALILIWTTMFIDDNKDEEYIETIKGIVTSAKEMTKEEDNIFTDDRTTYFVSTKCVKGKENTKSPYGDLDQAYVVISYDGENYSYYFTGRDVKGKGFVKFTSEKDITIENLKTGIEKSDITTNRGVGDRTKVIIIDGADCKEREDNSYKVEISKIEKYEYDEKKAIKLYAYREIDEEYTVTKVGILYASNPTLGYYTNDGKNLLEDETYKVEELLKTNKNGNVSEIVAKNPTNIGDYALIYTIVKDTDMVYALPYVEATDAAGKEYKFYGPVTAANYEQAK